MTYSEESLKEAASIDHTLSEFFMSAKAKARLPSPVAHTLLPSWQACA